MSAGHHHDHAHGHGHTANKKVLAVSFFIIAGYMLVEIVGGLATGSLALLSDAGHMLSDALSVGLSLLAFKLGEKAVNSSQTFGYKRAEILFALFNGLTLLAIAVFVVIEAVERLDNPPAVAGAGMLAVGAVGLAVNLFVARYMHSRGSVHDNINMKSAYLHVLGDLLGSLGAVAAALLLMFFDWRWADPVISVLIALLIANSGASVLRHTLHIWTLTSSRHLLSAHLVLDGALTVREAQAVVRTVEELARGKGIGHITLQTDAQDHTHGDHLYCQTEDADDGHGRHH